MKVLSLLLLSCVSAFVLEPFPSSITDFLIASPGTTYFGPADAPDLMQSFSVTVCSDATVDATAALCAPEGVVLLGATSPVTNTLTVNAGQCRTVSITACDNNNLYVLCPGYLNIDTRFSNVTVNVSWSFQVASNYFLVNSVPADGYQFIGNVSRGTDGPASVTLVFTGLNDLFDWQVSSSPANSVVVQYSTVPSFCTQFNNNAIGGPVCALTPTNRYFVNLFPNQQVNSNTARNFTATFFNVSAETAFVGLPSTDASIPVSEYQVYKVGWPWFTGAETTLFDNCFALDICFEASDFSTYWMDFNRVPGPQGNNCNNNCCQDWTTASGNGCDTFLGCDLANRVGRDMYFTLWTTRANVTANLTISTRDNCGSTGSAALTLGTQQSAVFPVISRFSITEAQLTGVQALSIRTTGLVGAGSTLDVLRQPVLSLSCNGNGVTCGNAGTCTVLLCDLDPTGNVYLLYNNPNGGTFDYNVTVSAAPAISETPLVVGSNTNFSTTRVWNYFVVPSVLYGQATQVTFLFEKSTTQSFDVETLTGSVPIPYDCNGGFVQQCTGRTCSLNYNLCNFGNQVGDLHIGIRLSANGAATEFNVTVVLTEPILTVVSSSNFTDVVSTGNDTYFVYQVQQTSGRFGYLVEYSSTYAPTTFNGLSQFSLGTSLCNLNSPTCVGGVCRSYNEYCGSFNVSYVIHIPTNQSFTFSLSKYDLNAAPVAVPFSFLALSSLNGTVDFPSTTASLYYSLQNNTQSIDVTLTSTGPIRVRTVTPGACSNAFGNCGVNQQFTIPVGVFDLKITACPGGALGPYSVNLSATWVPTPVAPPLTCFQPATSEYPFCSPVFSSLASFETAVNVTLLDQQAQDQYNTLLDLYGTGCSATLKSVSCNYFLQQCGLVVVDVGTCRQTCLSDLLTTCSFPASVSNFLCNSGNLNSCNCGGGGGCGGVPTNGACLIDRDCASNNCVLSSTGAQCDLVGPCVCSATRTTFCTPGNRCTINGAQGVCDSNLVCVPNVILPPTPAPAPVTANTATGGSNSATSNSASSTNTGSNTNSNTGTGGSSNSGSTSASGSGSGPDPDSAATLGVTLALMILAL